MNTDQLVALCLRHHALLLTSDSDMVSIAVVGSPAPELMEALRFATQKRIDIECWSAERMEKHRQLSAQSHLPNVSQAHSAVDILNHTLQQAINQRASDIHIEPMEPDSLTYRWRTVTATSAFRRAGNDAQRPVKSAG